MATPDLKDRFSRQVILPGVGAAGQEKWAHCFFRLAGEGVALQAARTALETAGAPNLLFLNPDSSAPFQPASFTLVVTEDEDWRRRLSRQLRSLAQPTLFAWPLGSGYALFLSRHKGAQCPCLECFEVMNPKAFSKGRASVQRLLGAMAASEALQWVLDGGSPLEGKVWVASLQEGLSFQHDVTATPKCPVSLADKGARVTP